MALVQQASNSHDSFGLFMQMEKQSVLDALQELMDEGKVTRGEPEDATFYLAVQ